MSLRKFQWVLFLILTLAAIIIACTLPGALPKPNNPSPTPVPGANVGESPTPVPGAELPNFMTISPTPVLPTDTPTPISYVIPAAAQMKWVDGSELVYVPGGVFGMGDSDPKITDDSDPLHKVTLNGYWIYMNEVTNRMFMQCVEAGECTVPAEEEKSDYFYDQEKYLDYPVVGVDWNQAAAYCAWAKARLPSEAEWEKAARGEQEAPYPWGDTEPACNLLNFDNCIQPTPMPAQIGSYVDGESVYEALDMAGNVAEWVNDWYAADYYTNAPAEDPRGPENGEERVIRSSSFRTTSEYIHVAIRDKLKPEQHRPDLGFRCVPIGEEIGKTPPLCEVPPLQLTPPCPQQPVASNPEIKLKNLTCEFIKNGRRTALTLEFSGDIFDAAQFTVTANEYGFDCQILADYPKRLYCFGEALDPGYTAKIQVCGPIPGQTSPVCTPPPDYQPNCPLPFSYNSQTGYCETITSVQGECPKGYTQTEWGCLPNDDGGRCPEGYFFYPDYKVCLPAKIQTGDPSRDCPVSLMYMPLFRQCSQPANACLKGYTYDQQKACCVPPKRVTELQCPPANIFSTLYRACTSPNNATTSQCANLSSTVFGCPTPTAVPGKPVDPCRQYDGLPTRCKAAGCNYNSNGTCTK